MATSQQPGETLSQPDTEDMVVVHRMFRRELAQLPTFIAAVPPGDRGRARALEAHTHLVLAFLSNHHEGEDALLWPLLVERAHLDRPLLQRMEIQHLELEDGLARVDAALTRFVRRPSPRTSRELSDQCGRVAAVLVEHLDEEERYILPLVRRHVSQAEWSRLAEHGRAATPRNPRRALTLLGLILQDADPDEAARFLATVPASGRMAWRTLGRPLYRRHVRRLHRG